MNSDNFFVPFFLKHCESSLLQVLQASEPDKHYGVPVSLARLRAAVNQNEIDTLIAKPKLLLPFLDGALIQAQAALLQKPLPDRHLLSVKENVHARLHGLSHFLDASCSKISPRIGEVSAAHLDKLITVRGTVVRAAPVKLLEARRLYECGKCRHRFVVAADLEQGATVQLPSACPSNRDRCCTGTNFRHCEEVSLYTNYQEIQIQEGRQCLTVGSTPRTLTVVLQDEFADACQVGELVEVSGIVIKQWGPTYPGMRCHVGLALQVTALTIAGQLRRDVEVTQEAAIAFQQHWERGRPTGPLATRDAILASFCPQLCGLFSVKLASMLMLIGGVSRQALGGGGGDQGDNTTNNNNRALIDAESGGHESTTRGEIHFLLVGDPGTGKSQIQRYVSRLSPRSVLTSGNGSSAAGLTAAAVKDGANWVLEAGALVLADGGVCCIDEFDSVREVDRASLHEAMEQQTCSIAKAGMVTTLHTRASVFGTCNPRGHRRYNPRRPLAEQIAISGPLLSRFDVVLLLLDDLNPVWDDAVADHILAAHTSVQNNNNNSSSSNTQSPSETTLMPSSLDGDKSPVVWEVESLRQYVAWVKTTFFPVMTPAAEEVLSGYYQLRRGAAGRHAARATLRLLESLVRLAQAHARLMARSTVDVVDAVTVVALIDSSVVDGESVLGLGLGHAVGLAAPGDMFHECPDVGYRPLEAAVLAAVTGR